jgi:ubiquitin-conjugating enzyme E2 variant
LILSHEEHHRHHIDKFDRGYCIINGWMNPFLEYIDYWRRMETLITKVTGAQPRVDDEYWRPKTKTVKNQ